MRDECGKDRSLNLEGVDKKERERETSISSFSETFFQSGISSESSFFLKYLSFFLSFL